MLAAGLVAAYGFNTGSGTTLVDSSGNGNNGTISGASWATGGKYGDALSFNGTNSWVTIPDSPSLDLTTGMTVEAWVDPGSLAGSAAIAVKEQPNGLSYALYGSGGANAPPSGSVNTGGNNLNATGASALPLNTWSYLATTYDGAHLDLYVNGTLVQSTAAGGAIAEPGGVLRIGGDSVWGDYFSGLIDELRVYNVALSASQIQGDMSTPVNPPSDTQPPTVSITTPANNATVTNTVTVTANASDDDAVADVQFQVDGANAGAPVTTAPYTFSWDTTQAGNGPHTLTAVATDVGGLQTTSAPVQVTVSNVAGVQGQWSSVMNWGLIAINQVLLDNGNVLMWDGGPACIGSTSATVYNPNTGTFTPVPVPFSPTGDNDIFCSGMATLSNGDILVVGGHDCTGSQLGADTTNIFDPATDTWTSGPTMAYYRWYPTATTLPSGNVLITTGSQYNNTDYVPIPELYNATTNKLTTLTNSPIGVQNYPFMFVLPNGNVLEAGSDEGAYQSEELNLATDTWSVVDPNVVDGSSAVQYQPGKILKAGASDPETASNSAPSSATAYVLDTTQPTPRWQQTASMSSPRTWLNLTVLPDGNVLATGGGTDLGGVNPANAVYSAEEWSPTTQTWTTMASMSVPRLYHSTALLLPDGRVLVAGGGNNYVNNDNYPSAQIYSPPYLFNGPRPTITSAPSTVQLGSNFFVRTPDAASIASVSLIRMGDVTHSVNMGQSFQNLAFQETSGGLTIQAPANSNLAPPGYYMLFILNGKGVPSLAAVVQIPVSSGDTQPPTAPTNLVATSGVGIVSLGWTPSTDNVGVVGYNIYRSTTSGFAPSPSTLIGQATGTSYTDTVAAGTYFYLVAAYDAAGNISAPSNQATATVTTSGIRLVQDATSGSVSSGSKISLAFPSSTKAGDFLIVTGVASSPEENLTISDSAGDTFIVATGPVSDTAEGATEYVWYVADAKGGADTVTLTPSSADALEIHVSEWTGINPSSPVDQVAFATGSGGSISSGAKTTTQGGELVYGYTFVAGNATAGAGFTGLTAINGDEDEYQIQGAAGSVAATFTQSPSGAWSALMVTFRPGAADTQPPTAPANLAATGGVGRVSLTWTASTDNVGVAGYDIYRSTTSGFAPSPSTLIGQATGTSYTDTVAAGTYYYLVTAYDAAGNVSAPSNQATATATADTQPPTAPANLTATAGSGSVALSWVASTDNVGVAGYDIYRSTTSGFAPSPSTLIGQATGTSYTDTVAAGTYFYLVAAYDAAGNMSGASNQATATVAPSPPRLIQDATNQSGSGASQISVAFPSGTNAGDFLIVTGFASAPARGLTIADSAGDTFATAIGPVNDTAQGATEYIWYVAGAKGGANTVTLTPSGGTALLEIHVSEWTGINASSPVDQTSSATGSGTSISSGARTTTQNGDLIYGYALAGGSATAGTGFTSLTPIDGDVDEYRLQGTAGSIAATFTQRPSSNWSAMMVAFKSGSADTQPPTAPTNLSATTGGLGSVGLTWTASTDNVGVVGYDVYRSTTSGFTPSSSTLIGQATTTSYTDTVAAGTYYYLVTAYDAAGNVSAPSNQATGTSLADTQPPTAPTNLVATGAIGSVGLTWTASTDNVGVAGYDVYRSTTSGFAPSSSTLIGLATGTTYTDNVAAGTYYYLVAAYDAAGNVSTPSNQATGTSLADTQPPAVSITSPASGATVSGTVSVTASATDNVAVASVQFQLDGTNLGAAITKAPYTYSWNTTTASNGSHLLTAIATDTSGNQATASESVTVNNTSSLVASYGFDEGSGTTTVDGSGNGNTGTLSNATWTTAGKSGDALKFNGTTSTVVINDATSLDLTTGMTLEAWVYPTSFSNSGGNWDAAIAKEHLNSSNDIAYALYAAAGSNTPPAVHILVGSTDYGAKGTSVLPLNTWTFLAGTYDGKTLKMYVNGTLVGSTSISGKIAVTTNPLKIGGDWDNEMFTGTIDSVRIYNTALTQAQIQGDQAVPLLKVAPGPTGGGSQPFPTGLALTTAAPTAATHTWTGADGPLWSDAGNWIGGAPTEPGAVLVFPAGASDLTSTNDLAGARIGSIIFTGGGYTIGGHPLTLTGGIATGAGATGVDTINAGLAPAGDLAVSVLDTRATVVLAGAIGGPAGLSKDGDGHLVLSGTNTYAGTTVVEAGVLVVESTSALGLATGGTFVERGAALDVQGGISVPEPVTIDGSGPDGAGAFESGAGYNLWTGPITLAGDATIGVASGSTLTLRGVIDGPGGLTKVGLGFLVEQMFASNSYAGATTITAGSVLLDSIGGVAIPGALVIEPSAGSGIVTVECGRDGRTAPTSTLTIDGSGVLDLLNHSITFATVALAGGTINTGDRGELDLGGDVTAAAGTSSSIAGHVSVGRASPTFTIGAGGTLTISASIEGDGGLIERGAGHLILSGVDTHAGATTVAGGTLTVVGTLPGGVVVGPGGVLDGPGGTGSPPPTVAAPIGGQAILTTAALAPSGPSPTADHGGGPGRGAGVSPAAAGIRGTRAQRLVEHTYRTVIGHLPEPAGLAHWVRRLHRGVSAARVVHEIRTSLHLQMRLSGGAAHVAPSEAPFPRSGEAMAWLLNRRR